MHTNFDHAENFEALLASEFDTRPNVTTRLGEDYYDAGYRMVNRLSEDLTLDISTLDFDELD
jgi:hypothetical protein